MQGAVTPDGLALFAAFVRLLPLVNGCNRPRVCKNALMHCRRAALTVVS